MKKRTETKKINIGKIYIGGQDRVLIQSMCNIKTSKTNEIVDQINKCQRCGADLMRVSILDEEDIEGLKRIKEQTNIPIIADIHFNYLFAIGAIKAGADAIRINPGNIGNPEQVKLVVEEAKKYHIPIRVGVNSGSLDKTIHDYSNQKYTGEEMVRSAHKLINILEEQGFYDIVISLKGSNVLETINAYRLASEEFSYPLHLGITEAGPKDISLIRSSAGLSPLLLEGIGDTIRISISGDPVNEVIAAKRLLHDVGLYNNYPTIVSCPTCGRTQVDVVSLAKKVFDYLETYPKPIHVAVMGCVVNGPGEAKNADIGIAGGKNEYLIFKKGKITKKVKEEQVFEELIKEINNF